MEFLEYLEKKEFGADFDTVVQVENARELYEDFLTIQK